MLVDRFLQPICLNGLFAGRAAFLLSGGPALTKQNLMLLPQRGVLTMAMNSAATSYRPQLWVCDANPVPPLSPTWHDPGILKFVSVRLFDKTVKSYAGSVALSGATECVRDMPGVFGYTDVTTFEPIRCNSTETGTRYDWSLILRKMDRDDKHSIVCIALQLLCYLGVRHVYLLGDTFQKIEENRHDAGSHASPSSAARRNPDLLEPLTAWRAQLLSFFEKEGLQVFQCTADTGQNVFPVLPFRKALRAATAEMLLGIDPVCLTNQQYQPIDGQLKTGIDDADFTTIVTLDQHSLEELKFTWPTWRRNRPELMRQPLLLACDSVFSESEWRERLAFVDHLRKRIIVSNLSGFNQEEKSRIRLVFAAARDVQTPWFFHLATNIVAAQTEPWIRPEWFAPDERGRPPVLVAPPCNFIKPADLIIRLNEWGDTLKDMKDCPPLVALVDHRRNRIRTPGITSWCLFGNTAWIRQIVESCQNQLPVPFPDAFLWYWAQRRGDFYRRAPMEPAWVAIPRRRRLAAACQQRLESARRTPPDQGPRGVVYLLTGVGHAVRLAVSLWSLRRYYNGPVTLFTTQPASHAIGAQLAADRRLALQHQTLQQAVHRRNSSYLTKVKLLPQSPYETTLFLDADTLVTGAVLELFEAAEESGFAATRFAEWTTSGRRMQRRITSWRRVSQDLYAESEYARLIEETLQSRPAINTGVFAYRFGIPLLDAWQRLTNAGWRQFICDEIALQILLQRFSYRLLNCQYNCSPVYASEMDCVRIWHFHGDKHLCTGRPRDLWLPAWEECLREKVGGMQDWFPAGDSSLEKHLAAAPQVSL
jgi:hypothetical protein